MTVLPDDLYIPPDALAVYLGAFEGPLDLLLYLIRKHHLDVLDIPMAQLTAQYMEYVHLMRNSQLELAAEYLLMAALLIEIKSRMLLPRPVLLGDDDADLDPRATLVRRLLEYEQMKLAAQQLDALPRLGRDFVAAHSWQAEAARLLPQVHGDDLRDAWLGLIARAGTRRHHQVTQQVLSVREAMGQILHSLQGDLFMEFTSLFEPALGVSHVVVKFLAMLELAREHRVEITQNAEFAPIYLRLAGVVA
ncbi:MAG: segregation/condensation protein A [Sulfuriferula sp.]|nr:segregation/condensation protein A [Sulfuriferula sp.]